MLAFFFCLVAGLFFASVLYIGIDRIRTAVMRSDVMIMISTQSGSGTLPFTPQYYEMNFVMKANKRIWSAVSRNFT